MKELDQLRALAAAVTQMRSSQKAFFANRRIEDLEASRTHEREVDRRLAEIESNQRSLF